MKLSIIASRFYPKIGKEIPIALNQHKEFNKYKEINNRLRVIIVKKGSGIFNINAKSLSVVAPFVLCINENESINLEDSIDWESLSIYFHPQFINETLNFDKIKGNEPEHVISSKQDIFLFQPFVLRNDSYIGQINIGISTLNVLQELFSQIKKEIEEQSHRFWSCRARSYLIELLFTLVTMYQKDDTIWVNNIIDQSSPLIKKTILYLNANYADKITVSQLSMLMNTNRTTLQKQFHEATGMSVIAYLISLRIKLSTFMLKDTGLTITEISERLGFSDNAHFTKMFKKITGITPQQYRKDFT